MFLNTAFRLSFYATMALACCCLAVGDLFFLGWMGYVLPCALALIVVAYFAEGRCQLSLRASNVVGLVVALAIGAWAYYYMPREEKDFIELGLPWPAALLPYLGPLLMVLLVLKLFQPKRAGDFWALQAIGLMAVALGCILSSNSSFGLLLAAYMAGVIWCLALHHLALHQQTLHQQTLHQQTLHQQTLHQQTLHPQASQRQTSPAAAQALFARSGAAARVPWRKIGLGQVVRWSACIVVVGYCVFLTAPRQSNTSWQADKLSNGTYSVGIGFENTINLANTGAVELSDDLAFEMTARSIHGPVRNLSPNNLYFVDVLDYYEKGQWLHWYFAMRQRERTWVYKPDPIRAPFSASFANPTLPKTLSDDGYYLTFHVPPGNLAFRKPLRYPPRPLTDLGLDTYIDEKPSKMDSFFQLVKGRDIVSTSATPVNTAPRFPAKGAKSKAALNAPRIAETSSFSYGQVVNPLSQPDVFPAFALDDAYREQLLSQELPDPIVRWVLSLLPRLPGLSFEENLLDETGRIRVEDHYRVATYLCAYLSSSGEFSYSLNLRRREQGDPTVDFLLNVKEGHCTRFAGGLALMLRAVGIPSRIVMGFRGQEGGENGEYRVRMRNAHSWVEALVKVPGSELWHWQVLDPTPGAIAAESRARAYFGADWIDIPQLWRSFVLDFTAERQARSQRVLLAWMRSWSFWLVVGVTLGVLATGRLAVRRYWLTRNRIDIGLRAGPSNGKLAEPDISWYRSLLQLLAQRIQLQPTPGQTPREFSRVVFAQLQRRSLPDALAKLPEQVVDLLYAVRFGGQAPTPQTSDQAHQAVTELRTALGSALGSVPA
ncbi:MAG: DUF4129 domain-containing protein [Planctomycetes bacterium]|nr:DUF4129 domain-containing protein [Planctomycetota bacterium]